MNTDKKIFFGWYVVAASTVGLILGLSTFIGISFGLFLKPLSASFGWSRTEISFALTLSTFAVIALAPFVGRLIDRFGVRRMLLPSIGAFGLSVCGLYLLTGSIYHFYAMFLLISVAGVITLPTSYTRVILNWFDRKRGIALGIALSGVGIGAVIMPPAIQYLISHWGWREAYLAIGLAALLISLPTMIWLLRERPEDMCLHADGGISLQVDVDKSQTESKGGLSLRESLSQRTFWLLVIIFLLMGIATIGTSAHLMPLLTDRGIPGLRAAAMISILGIALIVGRVVCGWLVDRFFAPYVASGFLGGAALGLFILATGAQGPLAIAALVLFGLGFGAEFDLMSYLVSRYLGLLAYGQIYGIVYAVFCAGAGAGPLIMGHYYDISESYTTGLYLFTACAVAAGLLALLFGPYRLFNLETAVGRGVCGKSERESQDTARR